MPKVNILLYKVMHFFTKQYLLLSLIIVSIFFLPTAIPHIAYATNPTVTGNVLVQDTFAGRTVSAGSWGTASDGHTWSLTSGNSAYLSVSGGEGLIASSGNTQLLTLGSVNTATAEALARFSSGAINADGLRLTLRQSASNTYYVAGFGVNDIDIIRNNAGTSTKVWSSSTFGQTNSTFYWVRFNVVSSGSNAILSIKVWQDGTSEPGAWTGQYTDTTPVPAGGVGIRAFSSGGAWKVDNFSVGDASVTATPTPTPTPTITPTPAPTYTLSGNVFVDTNGNGIKDGGETGYQGATVTLSGGGSGTTTTDASGNYSFSSLSSATYTVTLTDPGGYIDTTTNPASVPVSANTTQNFGIQITPTATPTNTPTPTPTPAPGLVVSTQTQSGISGGFANNQTETDVTWENAAGNGWEVGMIPTYGGANISPWYEISTGSASITQTNLATTIPDGFFHWVIDKGGTYLGTESSGYTQTEQAPTGTAFRRYYSSRVPTSGNDANGFNWTVKTAIYPGDPGLFVHRIDVTNPGASAITLGAADALETVFIGGLQQTGETVWSPTNGGYGTIGGSNTVGWPSALTSVDPDYIYITPITNSGISTGVVSVRKASLSTIGGSNLTFQYQQNSSRLKAVEVAQTASFPASTTRTMYYLQALRRNLTSSEAISLAADYLNPDTSSIMSVGTMSSFSYDEGAYQMTASNNAVQFFHTIAGNVTERWFEIYKIANYTSTSDPLVKIGSTLLTANTDYVDYVDTANQIAYVKLMKPLVASGATSSQFNNASIQIYDPASPIVTPTPTLTPTPVPTYTLSGTVYTDTNTNGVQDIGETGYQGATVAISGAGTGSTTTDASGNYSFTGLSGGTYTVTLTLPSGKFATTSNPASVVLSSNTTTNFGIATNPASISKVFVILMENANWSNIVGSASASYINSLLTRSDASYATQYYNPAGMHPSEPNYVWLEAGTNVFSDHTFTTDNDPSASNSTNSTSHLSTLLTTAGKTWKSYQENKPSGCPIANSGNFADRHEPFVFFQDVSGNPPSNSTTGQCNNIVDFSQLSSDLTNNTTANYNFITPNLCNDMHTYCGPTNNTVLQGDTWLSNNLPAILSSQSYVNGGAIFITWDEGSGGGDGPIGMIVLSPLAKGSGYHNTIAYDHSSYVKTMENIFGLSPYLGNASAATSLSDLFQTGAIPTPTNTPTPTLTNTPTPTPTTTPSPTPVPTYSLSGTVYVDTNSNGVKDTGESGYTGATVTVSGNAPITTDSSGNYTVTGLITGTYTVTLTVPGGYSATTTNPATVPVSTNTTQNFGIVLVPTSTPSPTSTPTNTPTPTLAPTVMVTPTVTAIPTPTSSTSQISSNVSSPQIDQNFPVGFASPIMVGPHFAGITNTLFGTTNAETIISKNALHDDAYITISPETPEALQSPHIKIPFPWMQGYNTAGEIYQYRINASFNNMLLQQFDKPVTIILHYDQSKINPKKKLVIMAYSSKTKRWSALPSPMVINTRNATIATTVKSFTYFAPGYKK